MYAEKYPRELEEMRKFVDEIGNEAGDPRFVKDYSVAARNCQHYVKNILKIAEGLVKEQGKDLILNK